MTLPSVTGCGVAVGLSQQIWTEEARSSAMTAATRRQVEAFACSDATDSISSLPSSRPKCDDDIEHDVENRHAIDVSATLTFQWIKSFDGMIDMICSLSLLTLASLAQ